MKHAVWLLKSASRWCIHRIETGVDRPFDFQAVRRYWIGHRRRAEAWQAEWNWDAAGPNEELDQQDMTSRRRQQLIHAVLLTEPLTRIVSASAYAMKAPCTARETWAMLKSTTRMHFEARSQCLRWLLDGLEQQAAWAAATDLLRRDTERWTDLLLGLFVDREQALAFAHLPDRAAEVEALYGHRRLEGSSRELQALFLEGQRDWMQQHAQVGLFHPTLDVAIVDAAMEMLSPTREGGSRSASSPVVHRVLRQLSDLDALLVQLQ